MGLRSPARITGMQGVHLLQGRRRDRRENRELFQEGVEGWDTKIRPLVPKKTLAPTKALERGSSARNVTPGRAPRAWAVRSACGTNGTARWPVVRTPLPQLHCLQNGAGSNRFLSAPGAWEGRGHSPPVPAPSGPPGYIFPYVTVPLPSVRSFCSIPGVCVWEGDWSVLRRSDRLGAGAPRPGLRVGASAGPGPPGQGSPMHWAFFPCLPLWSLGFPSTFMDVAAKEVGGEASWASGSETPFLAPSPAPWPGVQDFVICLCSCPKLFSRAGKVAN